MSPESVIVFVALLTCSAFFSGTESALTSLTDVTLQRLLDAGHRRARLLKQILVDRPRMIAALLVGNNIVNTVLAIYAGVVFDGLIKSSGAMPAWAAPIAASFSAILVLLVAGEVIPKAIAVTFPSGWAMLAAWPCWAVLSVLRPITYVLNLLSKSVVWMLGGGSTQPEPAVSVDEIQTMAKMGHQLGAIDSMEMEIVQKASVLNETKVRDIMVPRTDIHAIPARLTLAELRQAFKRDLFSRTPVYLGDLDDIIGVLNFKELLRLTPQDEARFKLQDYLHPALFVPEAMSVGVLLTKMRERRTHMAIVIDEYGGTSGLVTFEDIVEVLVGRVEDEYDVTAKLIERRENGLWEVDGRLTLEELEETLGVSLGESEKEGVTTAAGLALKAFGKIPAEGDATTFNKLSLKVTRMRDQRVRRLELRCIEECPAETEGRIEVSDRPLSDESAIMPLPRPQPPTSGSQP